MKEPLRRLNDLDGKTWERYSISVWNFAKTREEATLGHPAMFPLELPRRLIQIYTRRGDLVLDPFLGSGSVVVAAVELGRRGIGFDINPDFISLARERLTQQKAADPNGGDPELHCDDAAKLLEYVKPETVDLAVTSPPYWNIMRRRRTADYKEPRPYSSLPSDLGNIKDYEGFIDALRGVFSKVHTALKPAKRCAVVVMDIRQGSKFIPLHITLTKMMDELGFKLEDIIIWDRSRDYSNLRPLGYPTVFIVNKIHEYILIFQKPAGGG